MDSSPTPTPPAHPPHTHQLPLFPQRRGRSLTLHHPNRDVPIDASHHPFDHSSLFVYGRLGSYPYGTDANVTVTVAAVPNASGTLAAPVVSTPTLKNPSRCGFWVRLITGLSNGQFDIAVTYTLTGTPTPIPGSGVRITVSIPHRDIHKHRRRPYDATLSSSSVAGGSFILSGSTNYLPPVNVIGGSIDGIAGTVLSDDPTNWAIEFDNIPDGIYTVTLNYGTTDGSNPPCDDIAGDITAGGDASITVTTAPPECSCGDGFARRG